MISTLVGCASSADTPDTQDELGSESATYALDGTADSAGDGAYTYFEVTADLRKCAAPVCGGWFLSRLNLSTTKCHDGRYAAACYTPVFDWSEANLSEAQQAKLYAASNQDAVSGGVYTIARGRFARTNSTTPRPELGRFVITEAWVADGDGVSDGVFVRVKDNGVRCFAPPCPSWTEDTLNTSRSVDIAGVDFTPSGLSDGQIEGCIQSMSTPDGLLVAGNRYTVQANGQTAMGRTATAAYDRLTDAP